MRFAMEPMKDMGPDAYMIRVNGAIVGMMDRAVDGRRYAASIEGRRGVRFFDERRDAVASMRADAYNLYGASEAAA